MKTKPFSIEAALRGDEIVTRNGVAVELTHVYPKGGLIRAQLFRGKEYYFDLDGHCGDLRENQLFMLDK